MEDFGTIELKQKWDDLAKEVTKLNTKVDKLRLWLYLLVSIFGVLFAVIVFTFSSMPWVSVISILILGVVSVAIFLVVKKQTALKEQVEYNLQEMEKIVMRIDFRVRVLNARKKGDK